MRLTSLHLENFRGFKTFDLDLHEQVTLLVGVNASGKTAVLEFPVVVGASGKLGAQDISWTRELRKASGKTTHANAKQLREFARKNAAQASQLEVATLPVLAYYGTGRLWVQKRATDRFVGSRLQGYDACLEPASNTKLFQRWVEWRQTVFLQKYAAAEQGAGPSPTAPHLDAVYDAARTVLPDAKMLHWDVNTQELRAHMTDGRILPFDRLSDGQRSLVLLAADLAWRATQLNPIYGRDAPKRAAGVVLIDELELHLHPSWQRTAIEGLTRAFPNLQFVISTHSPQVISTAKPKWIRILTQEGTQSVAHSYGWDSNAILRDIMGVLPRPAQMESKLAKLEQLIEDDLLGEARTLLEEVRRHLGSTDREVQGLEWELHSSEVSRADDS